MSRIFHRAAAVIAGIALPLSAWALVSPSNVDDQYVALVPDSAIAAEAPTAIAELPELLESEPVIVRADRDTVFPDDQVAQPEASTTACCVWIYIVGRWYCFPCV